MTTTSKEYAEALFELSAADKSIPETEEGLALVVETLAAEPAYRAMLASPAISRETRLNSLETAFRGKIPGTLLGVLRMMVSRGHISGLSEMARAYAELTRISRGEAIAQATSATPLSEAEQKALQEGLEKRFGHKVTLRTAVNPALIGGVRVEIEGVVIDGTIRNKLDQIKEVMHS